MKLAFAVATLLPAIAHADSVRVATAVIDGPPGSVDPVLIAPVEAPPELPAIAAQSEVVGSQRGLITGTALTVPAGKVELSLRTAVLVTGAGINAGLTPTTEMYADVYGVALGDGALYGAGIKQVIGRGDQWQLAATGAVHFASDDGDEGRVATVGGVLTMCTESCSLMLTTGVQLWMLEGEESIPVGTLGVSAGSKTVRLLGEIMRPLSTQDADDDASLAFLGLRFGSKQISLDLGLATATDGEDEVLPVLNLQIRP